MADEKKVIKPSLGDYIKAIKETQAVLLALVALTIIFLVLSGTLESELFASLTVVTGFLGWVLLLDQYHPIERIKAKAVVIHSLRQRS